MTHRGAGSTLVGRSFLGNDPRRRVGYLSQLPRSRARRLGRGLPRGQLPRLAAVKNAYDPHRFFDFPQAI
jgi:Berberine and berberine like